MATCVDPSRSSFLPSSRQKEGGRLAALRTPPKGSRTCHSVAKVCQPRVRIGTMSEVGGDDGVAVRGTDEINVSGFNDCLFGRD